MVAVGGVLGVLYVGVTFFQVLLAAGADADDRTGPALEVGAQQLPGRNGCGLSGRPTSAFDANLDAFFSPDLLAETTGTADELSSAGGHCFLPLT